MIDIDMWMAYLGFVPERHRVWESRQLGLPGPWTDDPIIRSRKFTNVFRVLDYGSQFLVKELLTPDLSPRDTLARCFLYRYTNLPATWDWMRHELGDYPGEASIRGGSVQECIKIRRNSGHKVFSGAYVILPQPNKSGDKVDQAVQLTVRWMDNRADDFLEASNQEERYRILRSEYGVGPFLAMQILTDWGYSSHSPDRENEFVVPGPGCLKGIDFIDPMVDPSAMIEKAREYLLDSADCPVLPNGRPPSLMDIQNTFCEFSKYARYLARTAKPTPYRPEHPEPVEVVLPARW